MCCVVWIRLGRAVEEKKEKEEEQEPPRPTVETIGYQTRYIQHQFQQQQQQQQQHFLLCVPNVHLQHQQPI